ncbi:histidine ammonia-lyase [Christiangramia sediminis]|uniref:Histidine ammonia-lyase n=1 Tax=Christiangramia sediminis TaxID=2881336 RepID=A0A9X1LH95_9FLAO|nr:histidine ammonia-lyase [Christiangramia sediminis]MCB7480330.1 histidine ammonia-lyase [Christiangramia sediminis]
MSFHIVSSSNLEIEIIEKIITEKKKLKLSDEARLKITRSREYLDQKLEKSQAPVYGINTGFGSLCNVKISPNKLIELQENLVMSHACGTGNVVPKSIIRLMLLFKIQSLSYGHSGVTIETVSRLIDFYNNDVLPVVYEQGSLGASGDLAPLAHLALPLLGKGEVYFKGVKQESAEVLRKFGWNPIKLRSKEGLALLNGTQFMSAYGIFNLMKGRKLYDLSNIIGAVSIDAFDCNLSPFDELVHLVRPHRGQIKTAERIRKILEGSEIGKREKNNVQDPYSFRCIPQVHGATKDTLSFVENTFITEINSVTDNPNIFVEEDKIISGGNFHGQPLALALDYLSISIAELGNISERRIYQLISGLRDLPPFLVNNPGLNSGFMITQYTAASIVSQNKQYASPASIDSIVSSNGQEDHVSMGANAATKALKVTNNVLTILAIELFNSSQALYFRKEDTSPFLKDFIENFRSKVPIVKEDQIMSYHIQNSKDFISAFKV